MTDFAQLKVGEIKDAITVSYPDFNTDNITGKSAWVEAAQKLGITADMITSGTVVVTQPGPPDLFREAFEQVELEEETPELPVKQNVDEDNTVPKYTEVGWHDYIMTQFHESELDRGYPKVEGMRRLAEELLGEIIFSGAIDVKSALPEANDDPGRSVVNYEVQILWKNNLEPYLDLRKNEFVVRTFRGLASCYPGNVKGNEFVVFPESIAETRAEARALRKALGLKVVAAEELRGSGDDENKPEPIQESQKFFITNKAETLELDLTKLLSDFGLDDLNKADRKTAADIIKHINNLQRGQ